MNNLNQVFYLTLESIGILDNIEMDKELKKIGSKNQKDFPNWVKEFAIKPVGIIHFKTRLLPGRPKHCKL